jgi:REP element-mobilizing transposase RayT/DNA-binding CsgD family transcriptional regulator
MTRPLRIEYAGALYHVTSRGDRQENIYLDDLDREDWLAVLAQTCDRFNWLIHAYCQMTNHYHLLVETVDANLSRGMRQLNGVYTQHFNLRHNQVGHLFQGRYKAILVQRDSYLLELSRYVVLNPLRARMIKRIEQWPWSSYPAIMGSSPVPDWLDADWLLGQFGIRRTRARQKYAEFVMQGKGLPSPLDTVRGQLFLGDDEFVERFTGKQEVEQLREHSRAQRRALALTLREYQIKSNTRDEAMNNAYRSGAYTMREIADFFGVHYMTVSRAVKKLEKGE